MSRFASQQERSCDTKYLFLLSDRNGKKAVLNSDGTIKRRTPWNCAEVYVKIAGEWKVIHEHWSFIKGERKEGGDLVRSTAGCDYPGLKRMGVREDSFI